ncbi:tetratricopeptide repeat protein, partial [Plantactinospora solaniradicis]
MFWRRPWSRLILLALALGATVVAVAWSQAADGKPQLVVVLAVVAALLTAFAPPMGSALWRLVKGGDDADLKVAASKVAVDALFRVRSSSVRRRLYRPAPLRVRFRAAVEVSASRSAVFGSTDPGGPGWQDAPLEGDVSVVAERLRELPWRQLVVIGEPGAGKSVMVSMLVDQMLSRRVAGEPVPVLLAVSSWNPVQESVSMLVARRLLEDFEISPGEARRLASQPRMFDGDESGWWVLPILDGLDEIDTLLQPAAVQAIERFAAGDRGVVVTCRVREFQRAVATGGMLARAAVVRLEPLESHDVIEFLAEPASGRARWEPVFAMLREQPSGVLAETLATPLMVGLAKDVYAEPAAAGAGGESSDPAELVQFETRGEIAARLIDGYISTVYDEPGGHRGEGPQAGPVILARDAARWLTHLAYIAYLDGSRDLRWWRLPWVELMIHPRRALWWQAGGLAAAVAIVVAVVVRGWVDEWHGVGAALTFAVLVAVSYGGGFKQIFAHEFQPAPPRIPFLPRRLALWSHANRCVSVMLHVVFGAWCGTAAGIAVNRPVAGFIAGAGCGGVIEMLPSVGTRPTPSGPAATLRANHFLAIIAAIRCALPAAAVFTIAGFLVDTFPALWNVVGAASFAAGALIGAERAWLRFRITHMALSVRTGTDSMLPRRLIGFLDNGTDPDRAILRINGNAWQFRHAIIQDHLTEIAQPHILRRRADAEDGYAARQLAGLLRERGDLDGAVAVLRRLADAGDSYAAWHLAELLRKRGDLDGAVAVLRRLADAGDSYAARQLARLLRERGDLDEAVAVLRRLADAGNTHAARQLAGLLRERGDLNELRRRAHAGDSSAAEQLAELLRERGDLDGAVAVLRRRAGAGYTQAARQLAELLRERGDLDGAVAVLRRLADAGDSSAAWRLTGLLRERGDLDGAVAVLRRRADAGYTQAARQLAELLRERGDLDGAVAVLRRLADAGDSSAARHLTGLLRERGDLDGAVAVLRRLADAGDSSAARQL